MQTDLVSSNLMHFCASIQLRGQTLSFNRTTNGFCHARAVCFTCLASVDAQHHLNMSPLLSRLRGSGFSIVSSSTWSAKIFQTVPEGSHSQLSAHCCMIMEELKTVAENRPASERVTDGQDGSMLPPAAMG